MKITIKKEDLPKRRTPGVVAARQMKNGAHEKPYKTQRAKDKIALKKLGALAQ
jgi:hypothetical protein